MSEWPTVPVVVTPATVGTDGLGNEVISYDTADALAVDACVAPLDAADMRENGTRAGYTVYFPREFDAPLENARVTVYGADFIVRGRPERYMDAWLGDIPFNVKAQVTAYDG